MASTVHDSRHDRDQESNPGQETDEQGSVQGTSEREDEAGRGEPGGNDKGSAGGEPQEGNPDDQHDSGSQRKGGSGGGRVKSSHIITEFIDVGVPAQVAFDQWTQYDKWSEIFKKESADTGGKKRKKKTDRQSGDGAKDASGSNEVEVRAKIGPSERRFATEVVQTEPGRRISWKSKGGVQAMGSTSFHRLDDRLTHVMVEIEYKPTGFLEVIGNFFRMQRRRVRRDLRLFKHYIEMRGEATGEGPREATGDRPAKEGANEEKS